MELLRLLRAFRQEDKNVRLVFAGSIGFLHLLADSAEVRAAVNDLFTIQVGSLSGAYATDLSSRLLAGINVPDPDGAIASAMALASDGVPFYIQHIAADLERRKTSTGSPVASDVRDVRAHALTSGDDPWHMRHYDDRLPEYFGDQTPIARAALRAVAFSQQALGSAELGDFIRSDGDVL